MCNLMALDYAAIGWRVREMRMKANLTQEKLAELSGISPSFVGHIERGEKKASLETMVHIAAVLNTTTDYLLTGIKQVCSMEACQMYRDMQELLRQYGIAGLQS